MAHAISRRLVLDGPGHAVLHVTIQSDGQSPDLANYVLLDPNDDFDPQLPYVQSMTIKQVWYEVGDFKAQLAFNSISPYVVWTLIPGASNWHDWRFFGGLTDRSDQAALNNKYMPNESGDTVDRALFKYQDVAGIDSDGKLLLTTQGLDNKAAVGTFVLWLEKRDRPNPQPM